MIVEVSSPRRNEGFGLENPDLITDDFSLSFSPSEKGFKVRSRHSLPRRDGTPLPLDDQQREAVKFAMQRQFGFTTADKAKQALDLYRKDPTDENLQRFRGAQLTYQGRFSIVLGLRNIQRGGEENNIIEFDSIPANFPLSSELGGSENDEITKLTANSSTTMALFTKDHRLIIQHRNTKNTAWIDTPGASAAGYLDSTSLQFKNGRFQPISTESIHATILKELNEEIGLDKEDVTQLTLTAMVHEKKPLHDEFLFLAVTSLTAHEAREKARDAKDNVRLDEEEFREKFVDVEGTPEAIERFLTEMACPIPPSHRAAYISAGYSLVLERNGKQEADLWVKRVGENMDQNYKGINKTVIEYYRQNPIELVHVPTRLVGRINDTMARFRSLNPDASEGEVEAFFKKQYALLPKKDPNGFTPFFTPSEQGLSDFNTAMRNAGLIKEVDV